jgi:Tol biopolymer transport system component
MPDIGAARLELQDAIAGTATEVVAPAGETGAAARVERQRRTRERWAWTGVAAVLAGLAAFPLLRSPDEAPDAPPASHFVLDTPEDLVFDALNPIAVAPDGRAIVLTAARAGGPRQLWIRSFDTPGIRALPGTENARYPFWAPDSASVAFVAESEIRKLALANGTVQRVCARPATGFGGGTWSEEGTIVFADGDASSLLYQVSAAGGEAQLLTPLDEARGEMWHWGPQFLPDGRHILFVVASSKDEYAGTYVTALETPKDRQRLLPTLATPRYAASGHLVFAQNGLLLAQRFDAEHLLTGGEAAPIASGVAAWPVDPTAGSFSVSTGLAAWVSAVDTEVQLEWLDRDGKRLGTLGEPGRYSQIALSPDDRRVAVEISDDEGRFDLWVIDVARGVANRLTTDSGNERDPVWSPDSQELVYSRNNGDADDDLVRRSLQGAEPAAPLPGGAGQTPGERDIAENWSREGNTLIFMTLGQERTLSALPMDGDGPSEPWMKDRFAVDEPQVSPDGQWLTYISRESGRYEVYVEPFRRRGETVRVSASGGGQPRWRGDGKELFYLSLDGALMAVGVGAGATGPEVGIPTVLIPANELRAVVQGPDYDDYAVSADGQRFLVKRSTMDDQRQRIHVLLNWPSLVEL